ncbi:MAG: two-component system histidine kinase PnpS [Planctomycetaceae bacterium]
MIRFTRLFWKFLLIYGTLTAVTAAIFVTIFFNRLRMIVDDQVQHRLHQAAVHIREQASEAFTDPESLSQARWQQQMRRMSGELGMHVTLISRDGAPLIDSIADTAGMSNLRNVAEINDARASPEGIGLSERKQGDLSLLHYALRVGDRDQPRGFVRVSLPLDAVNTRVASLRQIIVWTTISIATVSAVFTYIVFSRLTTPVQELTNAATAIAEGNLNQLVDDRRRDEIGQLAHAFNQMARRFSERIHNLETRSEELKHHRDQLEIVLTAMVEGVLVVDRSERIVVANQAAQQLLDLGKAAHHGRPLWEVVRNVSIQNVVKQVLNDEPQMTIELDLPRSQSLVSLVATRLPGNPCSGVLIVLHDITELRRLENLRRDFVSNVSHELKTPLTSIQAYAETLLDGAIDDDEHNREFVHRIEEQAARLHNLILDLLNLARIESVQQTYDVVSVSVDQVVTNCIEQRQPFAHSSGIELTVERPLSNVRVMADTEGLHTILDNLVDNAIKYTPAGGKVTIRWQENANMATIRVSDTGVGIPQEHQPRVFERFYRVDKARSRELGGTGLGLSIVKHLTQMFGGSVEVASQVGSGTTFTITLPLATAEPMS